VARLAVIPGGRSEHVAPAPSAAPPAGEGGLLADLYARHAGAVLARCTWLLRDAEAARDATQEVFARALRALPAFRAAASPSTWLLSIATHHCLNELRAGRARWREEVVRLAELSRVEGVVPERRELVRALLARASPEEQEVAVMYYVDELTQAEIAAATGRSLPTVRKRLRGFLAAARRALADAFPGVDLPEGDEP
jgi:RNA polymerase sigma-70 factor, ECF subfamily